MARQIVNVGKLAEAAEAAYCLISAWNVCTESERDWFLSMVTPEDAA